ncbi:acyl carrier protein, partial [Bacillus sp. WP8]|uniref:acyl carrier protein n=1 Tax=Bacillus sp. WP8 TaxID=756828 RepID=UPI001642BE15
LDSIKAVSLILELEEVFDIQFADEELTNHGLDSIKAVSLILELEEVFDIQFADEELLTEHFSTINKIVHQLQNKLAD